MAAQVSVAQAGERGKMHQRRKRRSGVMEQPGCIDERALDRLRRQGGTGLVRDIVTVFLEDAPKRLEAGRAGARSRDLDLTRRAAHSLKATAATIGATELRAVSERIERLAADRQASAVDALLDDWELTFMAAQRTLQAVIRAD
jgi:two-component system, sensor histidine kinase and response regulator